MSPIPRYTALIRATLDRAIQSRAPAEFPTDAVSMETGIAFVQHTLARTEPATIAFPAQQKCVDGAGHSRSMYPGLLHYAMKHPGSIDASVLLARASVPASDSRLIVGQLWSLLSTPHALKASLHFASLQQPTGQWFDTSMHDNPESVWYHEIVALHAITSAAHQFKDESLHLAAFASATYIAREVQPDHASNQPWAMHALLRVPEAIPLADMMLHCAGVQDPTHMDAVSLILLADALRWLEA
jgi:hypothetical protein